jgi:hypothetical protein
MLFKCTHRQAWCLLNWRRIMKTITVKLPVPKLPKTIKSREEWLNVVLHKHVAKLLKVKAGVVLPSDAKVSVGFPGGGSARKRIGECWPRERSSIKVNEIFINPSIREPRTMVDVLVHEAIHAVDDCKSGHKAPFRRMALAVGLEGKMKSTHAGAELSKWIGEVLDAMPKIDYGSLDLSDRKKQSTRMLKLECGDCGYVVRTTQKWVDVGMPSCYCGGHFNVEG